MADGFPPAPVGGLDRRVRSRPAGTADAAATDQVLGLDREMLDGVLGLHHDLVEPVVRR